MGKNIGFDWVPNYNGTLNFIIFLAPEMLTVLMEHAKLFESGMNLNDNPLLSHSFSPRASGHPKSAFCRAEGLGPSSVFPVRSTQSLCPQGFEARGTTWSLHRVLPAIGCFRRAHPIGFGEAKFASLYPV